MTKDFVRCFLMAAAVALCAPPAVAGNWYVGLGFDPMFSKSDTVGTSRYAKSYLASGELRVGWEYTWYLAFEGRYRKASGTNGDVHASLSEPSAGVLVSFPKPIPRPLFLTGGVVHISGKSNLVTSALDANNKTVTTYTPYPSHSLTTWYVGAGIRYCERVFCPRVEAGYRGSELGGFYTSLGIDFRFP